MSIIEEYSIRDGALCINARFFASATRRKVLAMSFSRLLCFRLALFIAALTLGTLSHAGAQAWYPSVGPLITHAEIQRSQNLAGAAPPAAYGNARAIMLGAPSADQFERLKQLNATDSGVPKPLAVGFPRTPQERVILDNASLNWTYLPDGSQVAQVRINSSGAQAIRLGIRIDRMDAGVEMRFWGSAPSSPVLGPVKAADIRLQDGICWAPATFGEDATLEIRLPAGADPNALQGEIVQISHLVASPIAPRLKSVVPIPGAILSCEVDLACANDPKMTQTANAVAQMLFTKSGSSYVCTGTLMDDTPQDSLPYFYTAAHCISDQSVANTLITWWFYEAASCGGSVDLSQEPSLVDGAQLLYSDASTDATLLKLNDTPPRGVVFAGWDAAPFAVGDAVVGIHHPEANPAKYSSGTIANTNFTVSLADLNLIVYNFLWVQWQTGLVEPGSSGSGLFTAGTYIFKGSLTATPAGGQTCGGNSAYFAVRQRLSQRQPIPQPRADPATRRHHRECQRPGHQHVGQFPNDPFAGRCRQGRQDLRRASLQQRLLAALRRHPCKLGGARRRASAGIRNDNHGQRGGMDPVQQRRHDQAAARPGSLHRLWRERRGLAVGQIRTDLYGAVR